MDQGGDPKPMGADTRPHQRGGAAEFRAMYRAEFGYVWHTLRRLGIFEKDLPDVVHDVFVVVFRKLGDFDRSRPLRPWLFGIAFRVALDEKRRGRVFHEVLDDAVAVDASPVGEDAVEHLEARALVQQGLAALDLERRALIVLHDLEGHTIPAIAAVLEVPLATVYSRLRLAREAFAAAIRRSRGG